MRTLHVGLRVSRLARSLEFYSALGYLTIGTIEDTPIGKLTLLRLPDDEFAAIELVHDPGKGEVDLGTGLNHLVVQVEAMDETLHALERAGIDHEPPIVDGDDGMQTCWLTDPDGYRIELVQWPAEHAAGFSDDDFPEPQST